MWNILSDGDFELILANAQHVKNVPGRKTDVNDAMWLADLLAHGLVRGSFVPDIATQEQRGLLRTRKQLNRERASHIQRLQKTLEQANIKLDSVITDIVGKSGRAMIEALIAGETSPAKLAGLADKMTIVRSFTHDDGDHGGAAHWVKTGHPWPPQFFGKSGLRIPQTSPSMGSVISRARGPVHPQAGVPTYVCMRTIPGYEGDDAAWLGQASTPFRLGTASNTMLADMSLTLPRERLADRRALLNSLDRLQLRHDTSGAMRGMESLQGQAVSVILGQAKPAFDLSREDAQLRERYGPGLGQELLLARRLCEAGVGFVTINNSTSGDIDGWDHHKNIFRSCQLMCPLVDHAVSVFIEDLYARGLDQEVLLIITGEFGRTPRINKDAGRDHWAPLNPLLLVGGGLKMGQVIGASDTKGAFPTARPISPQDLMATCFRVLGIDQKLQYVNPGGQPISMIYGNGQPIEELH